MNIFGIGTDIVSVDRIKKSLKNRNFINRIFNEKEIFKCKKINKSVNCYAKRFAAKEAFSKALGTGISNGINFNEIVVLNKKKNYKNELKRIQKAVQKGNKLGLEVHAGHGLTYTSAKILSKIRGIQEFNIGHFLVGESIFEGIPSTIKKFKKILKS